MWACLLVATFVWGIQKITAESESPSVAGIRAQSLTTGVLGLLLTGIAAIWGILWYLHVRSSGGDARN